MVLVLGLEVGAIIAKHMENLDSVFLGGEVERRLELVGEGTDLSTALEQTLN